MKPEIDMDDVKASIEIIEEHLADMAKLMRYTTDMLKTLKGELKIEEEEETIECDLCDEEAETDSRYCSSCSNDCDEDEEETKDTDEFGT